MLKDEVLTIFEKKRGERVPGEYIASRLNVSEQLVSEAVKKLCEEGNEISPYGDGGYVLAKNCKALSGTKIAEKMNVARPVIYLPETDSTNTRAKILAHGGAAHGTVVVADRQTEGRGRRGRSFYSPAGSGVYFSVILRPKFDYEQCQKAIPMTAVAVSRAVEKVCGLKTDIKWVNDLYYRGKKVAGIAVESVGEPGKGKPDVLIVGIGINVTTRNFPEELRDKAGALGVRIDRNLLVAACVDEFFELYDGLIDAEFMDEYRAKCFVLGKKVRVLCAESYLAKAVRIDDFGALIVEKGSGERVKLLIEEVSVVVESE